MSVLVYCLPILLVHITIAQFPGHIDLQKVGEIIFKNEKYNVFKPTVHKITDHFKDFMMRRDSNIQNQKVFIDDNGFRHFWSGLGGKVESLRKTEFYEVNKNIRNDASKAGYESSENLAGYINEDDDIKTNNGDDLNEAADDNTENTTDNINTDDNVESTTNVAVRKKPLRPKTSLEEEESERALLRAAAAIAKAKQNSTAAASGKKVAKVSFFCPFFGIITMKSFIED